MPTRSTVVLTSVTLLTLLALPATAFASGSSAELATTLTVLILCIALTASAGFATLVADVLNVLEERRSRDVAKPRMWFLRLVAIGILGFPLAIVIASGLHEVSGFRLSGPLLWAIVFSSPLVMQSAYGMWTWHGREQVV
ncbi:MAG: hypothetical protein H0U74_13670 [Bradymonadaceae bacterium]|nr:hypothetical protein [Lujinxingiaceae bacterium]